MVIRSDCNTFTSMKCQGDKVFYNSFVPYLIHCFNLFRKMMSCFIKYAKKKLFFTYHQSTSWGLSCYKPPVLGHCRCKSKCISVEIVSVSCVFKFAELYTNGLPFEEKFISFREANFSCS